MIPAQVRRIVQRALLIALPLASGVACSEADDPEPEPEVATTPPHKTADTPADERPPGRPADQALAVDLQLEGLSPLYKGFFSDPPLVKSLGEHLAPHVRSRSATVKVIWDEATVSGSIQMLVPDGEDCLADVGRGLVAEEVVQPAPLLPYAEALDAYRRSVGDRYDLRVLSFSLALELWDPRSESRCLWPVTGGDAVPLALGPALTCRDPFGDALEIERSASAWPSKIRGSKKARKALRGALGQ